MSGLVQSSIARKVVMALSGLFLVIFLAQHFTINVTSVLAPETFNEWSHFMGYNGLVQFVLQPILIGGVVVHFVMGIVLELQNNKARKIKYKKYSGGSNASWFSRNMIITGAVVLAFLGLHFYDFWIPEMDYKYIEGAAMDPTRYYPETVHKFESLPRTLIYVGAFVLLAMHLWHGFASSFQTVGVNNKYSPAIANFTKIYAIAIPAGFIFIALYHYFNPLTSP
ncbi:MAG: succinate dehydrogenase cytochrome b subunit [Pricia sp.]